METHDILLVHQHHEAEKAGSHTDWRIVIGDVAHSWATKKQPPGPGDKIVLWEQPMHDANYALQERIEIPKGSYGAGVTTRLLAERGKAEVVKDSHFKIELNNGIRYTIKKMPSFGEKAWLLMNTTKSHD